MMALYSWFHILFFFCIDYRIGNCNIQTTHINKILAMHSTHSSSALRKQPSRIVTSLGLYSNSKLDDKKHNNQQPNQLCNSAKSIQDNMRYESKGVLNGEDQHYGCTKKNKNGVQVNTEQKQNNKINKLVINIKNNDGQSDQPPLNFIGNHINRDSNNTKKDNDNSNMDSLQSQNNQYIKLAESSPSSQGYPSGSMCSPAQREYLILQNKQKTNNAVLQSQLKQLLKLTKLAQYGETQKQLQTELIEAEASIRSLKGKINENKSIIKVSKDNQARLEQLKSVVEEQRKIRNMLSIKELQLEQQHLQVKHDRSRSAIIMEDSQEESSIIKQQCRNQTKLITTRNPPTKRYSIDQPSEMTSMSLSRGLNLTKLPHYLNHHYYPDSYSNQYCTNINMDTTLQSNLKAHALTNTLKLRDGAEKYRELLMYRIAIMQQNIRCSRNGYRVALENHNKQKLCMKKTIQLLKLQILKMDNDNRKIKQALLRRNSLSGYKLMRVSNRHSISNRKLKQTMRSSTLQSDRSDSSSPKHKHIYGDWMQEYQINATNQANQKRVQPKTNKANMKDNPYYLCSKYSQTDRRIEHSLSRDQYFSNA